MQRGKLALVEARREIPKSKELRNRTRTAEPLESVALRRDLLVREHLHLEAEHRLRDAHDLCASDHTKDLISGAEVQ